MEKEELYKMNFNAEIWDGNVGIRRVEGGWIYMFYDPSSDIITSSVFVQEMFIDSTQSTLGDKGGEL